METVSRPCYRCPTGTMTSGVTIALFRRDGYVLVLEDVPALVCDLCGETAYTWDAVGWIEQIAQVPTPIRHARTTETAYVITYPEGRDAQSQHADTRSTAKT